MKHRTVECRDGESCHIGDRPNDMVSCNEFDCSNAHKGYRKSGKSSHNRVLANRDSGDAKNGEQKHNTTNI